jgi:argininosuccinate lyase
MMDGLKVRESVTAAATADPFLLATDLADYLVLRGVPFRQAHEVIGKLTAHSLKPGTAFPDMTLVEYRQFSPVFQKDVHAVLDVGTALAARKGIGAPSPQNVNTELDAWRKRLKTAALVKRTTKTRRRTS